MDELAESIIEQARELTWQKPQQVYEAASVLIAAQSRNEPISPADVSDEYGVEMTDVMYAKRRISKELGIHSTSSDPESYVPRYCEDLNLPRIVEEEAYRLIDATKQFTSGRAPSSIAASAVYVSSMMHGNKVTQREISDVANVSEVTIRSLYRDMADKVGAEIA